MVQRAKLVLGNAEVVSMAAWSVQKRIKVVGLLALSAALFYLAFTIDRVEGKVFEHTNVVKLDASNFDDKVRDSIRPDCRPRTGSYRWCSEASYSSGLCTAMLSLALFVVSMIVHYPVRLFVEWHLYTASVELECIL